MAKTTCLGNPVTLNPGNWPNIVIDPQVRCRVVIPGSYKRARIKQIVQTDEELLIQGVKGEPSGEILLARINTAESRGALLRTAAGGIILKWSHRTKGCGTLMTFPIREDKSRAQ